MFKLFDFPAPNTMDKTRYKARNYFKVITELNKSYGTEFTYKNYDRSVYKSIHPNLKDKFIENSTRNNWIGLTDTYEGMKKAIENG